MAARRETHRPDALWIDAPLFGFAPHQTDCPLGVLKWASSRLTFGFIGAARHAVFEDDAGYANRVQPGRDFLAFQLPVEVPVAASGTDQDRGPGVLIFQWPINRESRPGDVGNQLCRFGNLDFLALQLR